MCACGSPGVDHVDDALMFTPVPCAAEHVSGLSADERQRQRKPGISVRLTATDTSLGGPKCSQAKAEYDPVSVSQQCCPWHRFASWQAHSPAHWRTAGPRTEASTARRGRRQEHGQAEGAASREQRRRGD